MRLSTASLCAVSVAAACASPRSEPEPWPAEDLGRFQRAITTTSAEAQRFFDQGLILCYGFDHEVALSAFRRAAELDPSCAMAHWGMALAAGPHINNASMDEAASKAAFESARKALSLAAGVKPVERDLIEAITHRYAWPPPEDRGALDQAYAAAMRAVWKAHPDDPDVGALCAEALMDLRPWDLWSPAGEPRPETPEIISVLDAVLALDPLHPGALHYSIHTFEASPQPERALSCADRLRERVPGASHLVHMPAHIDMRLGHYLAAIRANQRAIEVDRVRVARAGAGGFYTIYRAHNYHFLMWAAMYDGQSEVALHAARELVEQIPSEALREMPQYVEGFLASPYHALVRFGRWSELVREPAPPADQPSTTAFWHYARGLADSALGRVDAAAEELAAFERATAAVPESYTIGNNPTRQVLAVAHAMLEGELEYRRGHVDRAFELLREAVAGDDALHYDEPWGWLQPARHALGALLLEQGRLAEAEAVYRRDLELHPNNGWSLHGLEECLRRSGKVAEADTVAASFEKAWQRADIRLEASCFCRRGSSKS